MTQNEWREYWRKYSLTFHKDPVFTPEHDACDGNCTCGCREGLAITRLIKAAQAAVDADNPFLGEQLSELADALADVRADEEKP